MMLSIAVEPTVGPIGSLKTWRFEVQKMLSGAMELAAAPTESMQTWGLQVQESLNGAEKKASLELYRIPQDLKTFGVEEAEWNYGAGGGSILSS